MKQPDNIVAFAMQLGLAALSQNHYRAGLKRLLYPVGYWRYPIFKHVLSLLQDRRNLQVLDVGSPKVLALWLALKGDHLVYATDLQDNAIFTMWNLYCEDYIARYRPHPPPRYHTQFQDARQLGYDDGTFDVVYSISVIEHIPDDGDSRAMREISRVLKPGGLAIIEVPYALEPQEVFVKQDVYDRRYSGTPVFFERHYDDESLRARLLEPAGLEVLQQRVLGERIPFDRYWSIAPEVLKAPFYWAEWIVAKANLRDMARDLATNPERCRRTAMDVTVVLQKR